LDSSAVLAVLQGEPGATFVLPLLADCLISAVNLLEVKRVMLRKGMSADGVRRSIARLHLVVVPFEPTDSEGAALIGQGNPHLSLGDCVCLALAASRNASEVLTADQAWARLNAGIKVTLIR
jgi:PIN domain nuclease of toxin-antitoxin system